MTTSTSPDPGTDVATAGTSSTGTVAGPPETFDDDGPWRRPPGWLIVSAAAYLTLPLILFMAMWLSVVTYPALLLLVVAVGVGMRFAWRPSRTAGWSVALAGAVGGVAAALSGILGWPPAMKSDWFKHASLTNTLAETGWPAIVGDGDVLRYYSGFYLVPAFAARLTGGDPRLLLATWFALGMAIGLALLLAGLRLRVAGPAVLVLLLISGWDSVACLVTRAAACTPVHQEVWSGAIPVNAVITGVLWRPHQLIPALILVPLVMAMRGNRRGSWLLIPLLVSCAFWGPFVAVGVAPLVLYGVVAVIRARDWDDLARHWLAPGLLAAPAAAVLALYLTTGAAQVPVSMLWSYPATSISPWSFAWAVVIVLEVLPLVALPVLARDGLHGVHRVSLVFTSAMLLVVYGAFNDLAMNAGLVFVVLFGWETAYVAAQLTVRRPVGALGLGSVAEAGHRLLAVRTAAAVIVFLGAQTAVVELGAGLGEGTSIAGRAPVDLVAVWDTCRVGSDCLLQDFTFQYQAAGEDFPSWLLRAS